MTYLRLALGFLLSMAVGFALADILLIKVRAQNLFKLWLGAGIGLGFTSVMFFTWRLTGGTESLFFIAIELAITAGVVMVWHRIKRRVQPADQLIFPKHPVTLSVGWNWVLNIALALAGFFALLAFVFGTLIFPHGSWDAWTIWNLSARFMFLGRDDWVQLFNPNSFHSDYPLLIGSSVARLWNYRSVLDLVAPVLIGIVFFIATFGLIYSLVGFSRGQFSTRIAGLAFFASSTILVIAPTQCADLPLGYFLLGALGCLELYKKYSINGFVITSGVLLGLGIWTKNEGWLLAISVLVGWITTLSLVDRRPQAIKARLREASLVVMAGSPAIVFALIQKWFLAPTNDLFGLVIVDCACLRDQGESFFSAHGLGKFDHFAVDLERLFLCVPDFSP